MWSLTSLRAKRSTALENFVRHPQKTFATISATNRLMHRSKQGLYSITLSAVARSAGGMLRPSALAVFDGDILPLPKSTKHQQAKPGMTVSANRRMFSREPWPNSST
jgi:hypothetical protein